MLLRFFLRPVLFGIFTLFLMPSVRVSAQTKTLKISAIEEGLLVFETTKEVLRGQRLMIFRKTKQGLVDVLARGSVRARQGKKVFVKIELDSVIKVPKVGDSLTLLSPPMGLDDEDSKLKALKRQDDDIIPPDPGFIEINWGNISGSLGAQNSTEANRFKNPNSYSLSTLDFRWFFEFAWQVGFSVQTWEGTFPTETYLRETGDSTLEGTQIALMYRFRRFSQKYFRPTISLISGNEDFLTFNTDEALISSKMSSVGLGLRLAGEFTSGVWAPDKKYLGIALHELFLDLEYTQIDVKDTGVIRRGEASSGSSALAYKLGATAFIYVPWLPLVKRFTVSAIYGQKDYSINFQGPTTSETNGIYIIPENGSYKESYNYYLISLGFRTSDFIGEFLMPR